MFIILDGEKRMAKKAGKRTRSAGWLKEISKASLQTMVIDYITSDVDEKEKMETLGINEDQYAKIITALIKSGDMQLDIKKAIESGAVKVTAK
jgi:hypothetical protein